MKMLIEQIGKARAAFTLMEVNLAIFIMAVGVLAMTALYPLGFRESEQSRDDVRAAVVADEVLGQLTAALSSRNITVEDWKKIKTAVDLTSEGWLSYCESYRPKAGKSQEYKIKNRGTVISTAQGVFDALAAVGNGTKPKVDFKDGNHKQFVYGLVAQWGKKIVAIGSNQSVAVDDWSRVSISFRMARRPGALLAAPLYYTEVHFQGDQKENQ